jgi:hypothetical protein
VVPERNGSATETNLLTTIGLIAGLLTVIAVPLLLLGLLRRRRELSELRSRLHATTALESDLRLLVEGRRRS